MRVVLQYYINLVLKVFLTFFRQDLFTQHCFWSLHVEQIVQLEGKCLLVFVEGAGRGWLIIGCLGEYSKVAALAHPLGLAGKVHEILDAGRTAVLNRPDIRQELFASIFIENEPTLEHLGIKLFRVRLRFRIIDMRWFFDSF